MKLYTYQNGSRALKSLVAAKYCNVTIDVPAFEMGVDNKTPQFLKMNPNGMVPTLYTPKGSIWESNAIARYVARMNYSAGLYGDTAIEAAQIDQWLDWCLTSLDEPIHNWLGPLFGYELYNKNNETKAKELIKKRLIILNNHLIDRTYIVNEQITLADIVVACTLMWCYEKLFEPSYRNDFPNVTRWYMTVVNQPEFIACYKVEPLCEKMMVYQPPKKEKVEKKTEEKKEQPKKEQPKKEENNDEEEPEKPKKVKNPLDELPKSTMDLDNWKRTYSNYKESDFYGVMKFFYEQYDVNGYSLWLCDYKFDEENTVGFKTSNLVGGFIQRTDELRRYSFGNMVILKKEGVNHFFVKGAWLIRGQDIKPMLETNPDSEYYAWTKVDLNNETHKKRLADCWCASETMEDYTVNDTMIFK